MLCGCFQAISPAGARIQQVNSAPSNMDCAYLGDFDGLSGWGNGEGQVGRDNAKNFALNKAGDAGATHIVWYPFDNGFVALAKARGYRCTVSTKEKSQEKIEQQTPEPQKIAPKPAEQQQWVKSDEKKSLVPRSGTGWVSTSGFIVTNNHVVEGASTIFYFLRNGAKLNLKLILSDKANDLALLQAEDSSALPVGLKIANNPAVMGSAVFTIGYPHPDLLGIEQKLSNGTVSSTTGMLGDPRYMQLTVPVQSGNSGGPLINMKGEVVGVVSSKLSALAVLQETGDLTENVNYAVKAEYVTALIRTASTNATLIKPAVFSAFDLENISSSLKDGIGMIIAR